MGLSDQIILRYFLENNVLSTTDSWLNDLRSFLSGVSVEQQALESRMECDGVSARSSTAATYLFGCWVTAPESINCSRWSIERSLRALNVYVLGLPQVLTTFNSWSWQAIRTALHCRALLEWMYRKWTRTLINRKERASLWETNMHVKPLDIERQWRRCYFPRQGSTTLFTRLNLNGQILLSHG